jgi:hypothetical protein
MDEFWLARSLAGVERHDADRINAGNAVELGDALGGLRVSVDREPVPEVLELEPFAVLKPGRLRLRPEAVG